MIALWGVWQLDYEGDYLLELYTEREQAERHANALGAARAELGPPKYIEVREHVALSRFDGLETTGRAVQGPRS